MKFVLNLIFFGIVKKINSYSDRKTINKKKIGINFGVIRFFSLHQGLAVLSKFPLLSLILQP